MTHVEPIHVIRADVRSEKPATTLCGISGTRMLTQADTYFNSAGLFTAVLASDPHQGPTCPKCRQNALRIRNRAARESE